jgi:hypothetical protein
MVLLRDMGQVETHFGPLGDSVNLDADRYTICDECTTGLEIILVTPNGTSR